MNSPLLAARPSTRRSEFVVRPLIAVPPRSTGTVPMPGKKRIRDELAGASGWPRRCPRWWNSPCEESARTGRRPIIPAVSR